MVHGRPLDSGAASSAASRQGKEDIGRFLKKKRQKEKKNIKKKEKDKKKQKMKEKDKK